MSLFHSLPFHLNAAAVAAEHFHAGQTDKLGAPYIGHPAAVAGFLATEEEQIVGFLHDTLEDTAMTEPALRAVFPAKIVDAVVALTHLPNEPRKVYLSRVIDAGHLAMRVKRADLRHNTSFSRTVDLDAATRERLAAKYEDAAESLGTTLTEIHQVEFPRQAFVFARQHGETGPRWLMRRHDISDELDDSPELVH